MQLRRRHAETLPSESEANARGILASATLGLRTAATAALVSRTRLEVKREIARQATRRSFLRRALVPVFIYVALLAAALLESIIDPSFDPAALKSVCLSCYALAIFFPCLVVFKERHRQP